MGDGVRTQEKVSRAFQISSFNLHVHNQLQEFLPYQNMEDGSPSKTIVML